MYKKRRQLLIALVLLGLIATGATIAFLSTATSSLTNTFTKGSVITELEEEVKTDGTKEPRVKNTGKNACLVRMRVSVSPETAGQEMTLENLGADGKWQLNSDDGFYYYQDILEPGEKTEPLFHRVTVPVTGDAGNIAADWSAFLEKYPDLTITVYHEACQTSIGTADARKDGAYDQPSAQQVWKVFEDTKQ